MTPSIKTLLAGAAMGAASLAPLTSATANVLVSDIFNEYSPSNPFTPQNPLGAILSTPLYETLGSEIGNYCFSPGNCTYDFYFTLTGFPAGATTQVQMAATFMGTRVPLDYDLFSGFPGATPVSIADPSFIAASTPTGSVGEVIFKTIGDGDYFVQVTPAQILRNGEVASGSLTETDPASDPPTGTPGVDPATGAPEPASWSLMLFGFGTLGGVLRARRAKPQRSTPSSQGSLAL
jgi:hypothetical protein